MLWIFFYLECGSRIHDARESLTGVAKFDIYLPILGIINAAEFDFPAILKIKSKVFYSVIRGHRGLFWMKKLVEDPMRNVFLKI
jgi:hypothetical protein